MMPGNRVIFARMGSLVIKISDRKIEKWFTEFSNGWVFIRHEVHQ